MKIIHICLGNFFIDNYGYQENYMAKYHTLQGHDVVVVASLVTFDANGKRAFLAQSGNYQSRDGYKVIRIDYKRPFYRFNRFFRKYEGLSSILKKEEPDVLFIHNLQFNDILNIVKYANENPTVTIYVDNHADYFNSAKNWLSMNILHRVIYRYYARKIEPFTKQFYGVLPVRCDFLSDVYKLPASKISLLEMGIDDAQLKNINRDENRMEIRKKHSVVEDDFLIITGGKIDNNKNIHLLMQAVKELSFPKMKLLIFGNVNPDFKSEFDNALEDSNNIIYIGWLDSLNINKYIMAADLAVMPGSHSVLWEQIVGCGVPAVFKHFKGMHHVDIGGNCLFLYKDSIEEIKHVITCLFENQDMYNTMKAVAVGSERTRFFYSEIARRAINC